MKFYLPLILIVVVLLSGCASQQIEIAQNRQLSQPTEQTEAQVIFKPVNYILDKLTIDAPHKMIYDRARWNSTTMTFYSKIKENTTLQVIREGIDTWNKEASGTIKFIEVFDEQSAKFIIRYATSGEYQEKQTAAITVTLGEARLDTVSTGLFNLTRYAEMLYTPTSSECESKITVIHELGHVLGFAHTTDAKSVMFPSVDCNAKITDEMKQTLRNLYSIEALPDLHFGDLNAEQHGKYVIMNFTVWNRGLIASENVSIEIKLDDATKMHAIPTMSPGEGLLIPDAIYTEKDVGLITLTIDSPQVKSDFDRENNVIILGNYKIAAPN